MLAVLLGLAVGLVIGGMGGGGGVLSVPVLIYLIGLGAQQASLASALIVGITSGGTFAGALRIAAEAEKGANIVAMLPDTAERYLSTPLFADIPADMNEDELAISRSTPGCQLATT